METPLNTITIEANWKPILAAWQRSRDYLNETDGPILSHLPYLRQFHF